MDDRPLISFSIPLRVSSLARLFAWAAIALAALQFLNGLLAFALLRLVDSKVSARLRETLRDAYAPRLVEWVLTHLPETALLQVVGALLTLLAGNGLLRGKRWAQLYFVAWIALVACTSGAWIVYVVCAVLGVVLPMAGAFAAAFGLAAFMRLPDGVFDRRCALALGALVVGGLETARDVYLAARWLA